MKRIRLGLAVLSAILLVAGYAASQYATFTDTAPDYAAKVDTNPVVMLSLVIFLAAVFLGFWPDREDDQG